MKRGVILLSFIFLFSISIVFSANGAAISSCSVKSSCSPGEITMASVADTRDAHISKDITKFPFKLCCVGTAISNSCSAASTNTDNVADIFLTDDSHVASGAVQNGDSICLSSTDNSNVQCSIRGSTCNIGETCVLSLYQEDDSHVADCSNSLANKICCSTASVKACYVHGETRSDGDSLQCCTTEGQNELYYSKEVSTDITGGCCVKKDEIWDSFRGECIDSQAIICSSSCSYTPQDQNYFSTQGCFYIEPLPYELSCCQATQFGVTDKFQTEIVVVRNAANECTGAQFCSNVIKQCSSTPDGFCPQNYGDWSTCRPNELGGGCNVCDPDCGTCGSIRFLDFPVNSTPNSQLTIKVEYSTAVQQSITLWRVNPSSGSTSSDSYISTQNCQITNGKCTATFSPNTIQGPQLQYLTTPNNPGATYTFKTYLSVRPDIIIQETGHNYPIVSILNPRNNDRLQNTASIQVNAKSTSNINLVKWYIEKRDNPGTPVTYSPVNVRNNQGSCTFCNADDCNLLGTAVYPFNQPNLDVTAAKDFDTLRCDNNDFRITVIAEDQNKNRAQSSILVSTTNSNAPCTDNCPVYDSSILKIVTAKVKTWI